MTIITQNSKVKSQKFSSKLKILGFLVLVLIFAFLVLRWLSQPPTPSKNYDEFAKCLADKQLMMYGAAWCSHCQAEKARFNGSFKYVAYVECPNNTQLCLEKGITGYPTWIDSQGIKYEGEQGLTELARISGCSLP